MNVISMLIESIRVANKLEIAGTRNGLDHATRFAAEYCGSAVQGQSEDAGLEELELIDGAFMKPF